MLNNKATKFILAYLYIIYINNVYNEKPKASNTISNVTNLTKKTHLNCLILEKIQNSKNLLTESINNRNYLFFTFIIICILISIIAFIRLYFIHKSQIKIKKIKISKNGSVSNEFITDKNKVMKRNCFPTSVTLSDNVIKNT